MLLWLNLVAIPLIARIFLVVLFPFSALDKIVHWNSALKQAESSSVPGGPALVIAAIVVELVTPVCIVIGWHDRIAAFVLAGFCVVTAVLYHRFWKFPKFWSADDTPGRRHFWDFLKNFGVAGGLVLVIVGADYLPASTVAEHPLSSAPVAASFGAGTTAPAAPAATTAPAPAPAVPSSH